MLAGVENEGGVCITAVETFWLVETFSESNDDDKLFL